ncbi:EF-hand calcium-binding domain-containing protein 6-like isoform X2 [Acipenser oxyrinchus oxyrinchus]|uniref:EF-hand calcium-binding domain-containing protein 6-like isoform X2 n=1 Tax=Acipenser oxyrinchus oxyrinchus TaxID=40147 RepID=A0AAD8D670_ACIOX|nr:EF-hand calcium-binding domain-containing protein 6-like isoform X2 [Acipenser oxyrinchus oxyrinchus]
MNLAAFQLRDTMAAVCIKRASSHLGIALKLPEIAHPLSRLGDPETLSVAGCSTQGDLEGRHGRTVEKGRASTRRERSRSSLQGTYKKHRLDKLDSWRKLDKWVNVDSKQWAEGRSVCREGSQVSSRPATQVTLQIDELELLLREKIKSGGFYSLKQLFLANDPTGRGIVSREALIIIITKFLGRFISAKQCSSLLTRLKLNEKSTVSFGKFCSCFGEQESEDYPAWLDPVKRAGETVLRSATQAHFELKKKVWDRPFEILATFPNKEGVVRPPELRQVLHQLGIQMEEKEFEKLWKRYDRFGGEAVTRQTLMKTLGFESRSASEEHRRALLSALSRVSSSTVPESRPKLSGRSPSKFQEQRTLSLDIEEWLKKKFAEGLRGMLTEFQRFDTNNSGKVSRDDFVQVLGTFRLPLKKEQLSLFLARCGLDEASSDVSYTDFLQQFQDRTEKGMSQRILSDPNHRFNRAGSLTCYSTVSAVEAKLINLLQSDFLSLLGDFHKMDTLKTDTVSQQQFRTAIETRFSMRMTEEELECLLEKAPLDKLGNVRYVEFLGRFDRSNGVHNLFEDGQTVVTQFSRKTKRAGQLEDHKNRERTHFQLSKIIKDLLKNNFQAVESAFNDLDEMNTRRLSPETMYQLLKRFDIHPHVSREEVNKLWGPLITNEDGTLGFLQFVRHFGFSPLSACYPNAKRVPPVKGDSDFLIRSRKLNSDTEITVEYLRAKVELLVEELWTQFQELDSSCSGFVAKEEFKDVLIGLCPELTDYQCHMIASKFDHGENRVSYVDFLHPFAERRRHFKAASSKLLKLRSGAHSPVYNEVMLKGLSDLTLKLRQKLAGDWKSLQKACKKLDVHSTGFLLLPEFRSVLKLCNIVLDEDDIYHVMSRFDRDVTGKINYSQFINDTAKNP